MDAAFEALMTAAKVPERNRAAVLKSLRKLRAKYPNETPAGLFRRARSEGSLIPPARCAHGVKWGECIVCDGSLGARFYFTGGGTHVHATPICTALAEGQEKVRRRGGNPEVIEVVPRYGDHLDRRDPCKVCLPQRRKASPDEPKRRKPSPTPGYIELSPKDAPAIDTRVAWGGISGPVVQRTAGGIHISVGGPKQFIPWGEPIRIGSRER